MKILLITSNYNLIRKLPILFRFVMYSSISPHVLVRRPICDLSL